MIILGRSIRLPVKEWQFILYIYNISKAQPTQMAACGPHVAQEQPLSGPGRGPAKKGEKKK